MIRFNKTRLGRVGLGPPTPASKARVTASPREQRALTAS